MLFENVSAGEERRELNMMSVWTEGTFIFCLFGGFEPESETPFAILFSPVL